MDNTDCFMNGLHCTEHIGYYDTKNYNNRRSVCQFLESPNGPPCTGKPSFNLTIGLYDAFEFDDPQQCRINY